MLGSYEGETQNASYHTVDMVASYVMLHLVYGKTWGGEGQDNFCGMMFFMSKDVLNMVITKLVMVLVV